MGDWTSAQLDVSRQTAGRLTQLAHTPDPEIEQAMAEGRWGLDRAAALAKLRQAGITPELFDEAAERYSLGRLYGLLERLRQLTPADEQDVFESRYLVIQPSLDESVFKLWGQLPGVDGRIVEKALSPAGNRPPRPPPPDRRAGPAAGRRFDLHLYGQPHRQLRRAEEGRAVTVAEVFIDATLAAESFGEAGPPSPPDRESVPTPSPRFSAPARSG